MFRIDNNTAVATIPVIPPVGIPGFFTNGNPVTAIPATVVDDWWTNTIQEEILTVVVNAGLTPNKQDHTQLWQAINSMIPADGGGGGGPDYDPFLPLTGGILYNPLSWDPLALQTDYGYGARVVYAVTGMRSWAVGCDPNGSFTFVDATAGGLRAYIELSGTFNCLNGLNVSGLTTLYGDAAVNGLLTAGTAYIGTLYVTDVGNFSKSITVATDVFANRFVYATSGVYLGSTGNILFRDQGGGVCQLSSSLTVSGTVSCGALGASGQITGGAGLSITGGATIGGQTNVYSLYTSPGGIYCGSNLTVAAAASVTGNISGASLNIAGAATFGGQTNVYSLYTSPGGINCGSNLTVAGAATVTGNITANELHGYSLYTAPGGINCAASLIVGGSAAVTGNVNCAAIVTTGQALIGNEVHCYALYTSPGGINCAGNAFIGSSMTLQGDMSVNSITMHGQLWMGGSAGVQGALSIAGDMSCNAATVNNNLQVGLSVGINGACTVNGDGSMNNFTANGQSIAGLQFYSVGPCWASAFNLSSDARTKENIEDLGGGQLDAIRSLRPIAYNLVDSVIADRGNRHHGFVAQELLETPLAHLVRQSTIPHDRAPEGLLGVDFAGILASAVGAIQELADRVAELESTRSV